MNDSQMPEDPDETETRRRLRDQHLDEQMPEDPDETERRRRRREEED